MCSAETLRGHAAPVLQDRSSMGTSKPLTSIKKILISLIFFYVLDISIGYLYHFLLGFSQNIGWFPLNKRRGKGGEQLSV